MALFTQKSLPNRTVQCLLWIIVGLLLANVYAQLFLSAESSFARLLDVNREKNIATAFSGLLLLGCAFLLGQVSALKKEEGKGQGEREKGKREKVFLAHWRGLCGLFVFMAIDECFLIHERLNMFLDDHFYTKGIFYYDWVIPGSIFVLVFVTAYLQFIFHLPTNTRWRFLGAGVLYLSGALGMEMVSGQYIYTHGLDDSMALALLNGIEEAAEMLGAVCFIRALLLYLQSEVRGEGRRGVEGRG